MRRLLREMDMVVMPRQMVIEAPSGRSAALELANRRLLRIGEAVGHPALQALSNFEIDAAAEAPDALARFFEALLSGAERVRLRFEPSALTFDAERRGLSADALGDLIEVPHGSAPVDAEGLFDAFLSRIGDDARAWDLSAEGVSEGSGDPDALERLDAAKARLPASDKPTSWTFLALGPEGGQEDYIVVADVADARLILSVPPDRLGHLTDVWRAIAGV